MYAVTSANAVSSLGTPYALQNSPLGYGSCGQKKVPTYLSAPQNAYFSPSDPVAPPLQLNSIYPAPFAAQAPATPRPKHAPTPLVNESFELKEVGKVGSECGLYKCGPGMKVYTTYENFNKSSDLPNSHRMAMHIVAFVAVVGVIVALSYAARTPK